MLQCTSCRANIPWFFVVTLADGRLSFKVAYCIALYCIEHLHCFSCTVLFCTVLHLFVRTVVALIGSGRRPLLLRRTDPTASVWWASRVASFPRINRCGPMSDVSCLTFILCLVIFPSSPHSGAAQAGLAVERAKDPASVDRERSLGDLRTSLRLQPLHRVSGSIKPFHRAPHRAPLEHCTALQNRNALTHVPCLLELSKQSMERGIL